MITMLCYRKKYLKRAMKKMLNKNPDWSGEIKPVYDEHGQHSTYELTIYFKKEHYKNG